MFKVGDKVITRHYHNEGDVLKGSLGIVEECYGDSYFVNFGDFSLMYAENEIISAFQRFRKGDKVRVIGHIQGVPPSQCLNQIGVVTSTSGPKIRISLLLIRPHEPDSGNYTRSLYVVKSSLEKVESEIKGSIWWV